MLFIKIILLVILLNYKYCHAAMQVDMPDAARNVPQTAQKCNISSTADNKGYGLKFQLPFMDMEIQTEHNLHILQEPHKRLLFVLHGSELYQMFLSRQEKRLSLIGILQGSVRESEPLGAKIIFWHQYYLIAVALEEHVEIYQISEDMLKQRAATVRNGQRSTETVLMFEPIQQLTLPGRFNKLYLTDPAQDQVMLIVAVNYTKMNGKFRTFEWSKTYFDPIEDLTVSPFNVLKLVGTYPKYLISGKIIKHQSRTILTVSEVTSPEMKLQKRQTLTVSSRTINAYTYRSRNYMIACDSQQSKCNYFRMASGQFNVYKHRSGKDLAFGRIVAGPHFLVATRRNEVLVFTTAQLDCYGSFTANETEVSDILAHANEHDEDHIMLNYKRPFNSLVRMVGIEGESGNLLGAIGTNATEAEDMGDLRQHQHLFEDAMAQLRSILFQRKAAMDVFRQMASVVSPKLTKLRVKHPVHISNGNIGIIRVMDNNLRSPIQLLKRIEDLGQRNHQRRFSRSVDSPHNLTSDVPMRLKAQRLRVTNLIYNGSVLPGFHLNETAKPLPILTIRPKLTTKVLNTSQLSTRPNQRLARQYKMVIPVFRTRLLNVKRINNISWAEFYDSLFLKNRDTKIEGRLILQADTKVENLWTPLLNNLVVQQLFNLKQPQVVHSHLVISAFFVSDLRAETVNGLNFAEDIVFRGKDTLVETPVKMYHVNIAGDILLGYDDMKTARFDVPDAIDLQQIYTGKVILNGSLTINNLAREQPTTTQVLVADTPFSLNILKEQYLLRNEAQVLNTTVVFGNAKVTVPSLTTNYLNHHATNQHLLATAPNNLTKPILLVFMSARVEGNIVCRDNSSKLLELHQNVVRHGEVANITAMKFFKAPLIVHNLMTLALNNLSLHELVLKKQLQQSYKFGGIKQFVDIKVSNSAYIAQSLNSSYLNNLPLKELLNYDYHLDKLYVPHTLRATNIVFHSLNGISFDEIFSKFNIENDTLMMHKNLIIEGNVRFSENLMVDLVNDISWQAYERSLVRVNENAIIYGSKLFKAEVTITKELQSPLINNVNMQDIFDNILLKSKPQMITGIYTFDNLNLSNLDVSIVNDMPTATLIDMRTNETVVIASDLVIPKMTVHGNIKGNFANELEFSRLSQRLLEVPNRNYRNIVVLGNAVWNTTAANDQTHYDQLQYLYKHAVKHVGDQVISGNVKLKRPLITKMLTKTSTAFIKDIDLDFIAKDCLLKNMSATQLVYAAKTFNKPIQMQNVEAVASLNTKRLNEIDVLRLNASLYRVSSGESIIGPLHFSTDLTVEQLSVQGTINGINSAQIYCAQNVSVPPVKLRNVVIDNTLQVDDINDMNLNYLLANRVTKHGNPLNILGCLTFENLVLNKKIQLQSINGIAIDDLVFKKSKQLQAIIGAKIIEGDLVLAGPAHVMHLNGQNLIDTYQQSVLTSGSYHFNNLEIDEATFEAGVLLQPDQLSYMQQSRESMDTVERQEQRKQLEAITQQLHEIDKIIDNSQLGKQQHLMYLDYELSTQIIWQMANETIEKSLLFETKRISPCERQFLQVQTTTLGNRLYLSNITSKFITANQNEVSIKAENYCRTKHRKVKSKIKISANKLLKVFGMKRYIESVQIYAHNATIRFVLVHAIDTTRNRNEVRILKIDSTKSDINDWQSITQGVGKVMRLFQLTNHTLLLTAGIIKHHAAVSIYEFSPQVQQFKSLQIIDGHYDIMEMLPLQAGHHQLILSCRHCQRIHIYEYALQTHPPYQIFQTLRLKTLVDKLFVFTLSDGSYYMLVLSENDQDYYHLYKYSHIQGWLHATYGYFHNIKMALPLGGYDLATTQQQDPPLLLLCGSNICSLVKAFVQI